MGFIETALGSILSPFLIDRPIWAVKLNTGKWYSEKDTRVDVRSGDKRPFDWTMDLIANGDIEKIVELWVFGPSIPKHPLGVSRSLVITEPGTAFQFKIASIDGFGSWERSLEALVIGKVTNKETGACECWIYDSKMKEIGSYTASVYQFGSWREGIAPISNLSHEVLGLRLN